MKPKVIIITANPKYINHHSLKSHAKWFYDDLTEFIAKRGYDVSLDPGSPLTTPDSSAYAWVGHGRGRDKLKLVTTGIKKLQLQGLNKDPWSPDYFRLSVEDVRTLSSSLPIRLEGRA